MRTLRRSLLVAAPLLFGAASLSAQTYAGSNPIGFVPGVTFSARNLPNSNPGGNDELYIANTIAGLGSASTRDSYTGTWAGTSSPRHYEFELRYNHAAQSLTFNSPHLLNPASGADNAASVLSTRVGKTYTVSNVGAFELVRLYTRQDAVLTSIQYDGAPYSGIAFPFALAANTENFFNVMANVDFTVFGEMNLDIVGTGVEDNRFEVGVGMSAVPEPSTYALMATGLVALGAVARRRRLS